MYSMKDFVNDLIAKNLSSTMSVMEALRISENLQRDSEVIGMANTLLAALDMIVRERKGKPHA